MSNKKITIGLTGPAGCGKSTVANNLSNLAQFEDFAFADPLKAGLAVMLRIPEWCFHDRTVKEEAFYPWKISPREAAQTCGTEWARKYVQPDVWVKRLEIDERFSASARRVVSDVRFDNEADWIRAQGGVVIHIRRGNLPDVKSHVSEAGVRFRGGDIEFNNDGDIGDCQNKTIEVLRFLGVSRR
jgi:energy-coupling factor transporter ATP-binding protein EcfA2